MTPQIILGKRSYDKQLGILNDLSKAGLKSVSFEPAVYISTDTVKNISIAHKNCVRKAVEQDWPFCVVMEDDVFFTGLDSYTKWFNMINDLPSDWDIFISGSYGGSVSERASENIYRLSRFSGLHLYAVNSKFYKKFLSADESRNIDSWISLKSGANIYCSIPMMAIQKPGHSEKDGKYVDHSQTLEDFMNEFKIKFQ
jgi:GR25 family glycosyltransferase involved in LPS biosynthesis